MRNYDTVDCSTMLLHSFVATSDLQTLIMHVYWSKVKVRLYQVIVEL